MFTSVTERPRNVNAVQSAAILYGDLGTSKAYVIGLAFALASYQAFWLIAAVSMLTALVCINYIFICKYYPNGGGVYTSAREQSKLIALIGAFFLIADYLVTAALSSLSSLNYLGVENPAYWALFAVSIIGILNYFGPRNTGNLAFIASVPAVLTVIILGVFCLPHIGKAVAHLEPLQGSMETNWLHLVGIIVALSGIEAIANSTGVMQLDQGSSKRFPSVWNTSTKAIAAVMIEVCFFTCLFALAMNALPGLKVHGDLVTAPGYPNVRDSMLRYMGEVFAASEFGSEIGKAFGFLVSVVFCFLLLSAVNTAIVALSSLLYVVSKDRQLPKAFQELNQYGVPVLPLIIATIVPCALVYWVHDVAGLADLYAIGFVGAIATNLGFTSVNRKLPMPLWERGLMFGTFLIMLAVEITLFWEKPHARNFALAIIAVGLVLRFIVLISQAKPKIIAAPEEEAPIEAAGGILYAGHSPEAISKYASHESSRSNLPLYLLYVKEQPEITEEDLQKSWSEDQGAQSLAEYAQSLGLNLQFIYRISDSLPHTIVETASSLKVSHLVLVRKKSPLKPDRIKKIARLLPKEIEIVLIS